MTKPLTLTPEALLAAPQRGAAVPNYDGKLALHVMSKHTFGSLTNCEILVMDLASGQSSVLVRGNMAHDAVWIPGTNNVAFLKSRGCGETQLVIASGQDAAQEHYVAGEFEAPVSNMKLKALANGTIVIMVTGLAGEDGHLHVEREAPKSTARIFDTAAVRVWNTLYNKHPYSLWYSTLQRQNERWALSGWLHNLVNDASLDAPLGMYDMGTPLSNFDISDTGVVFLARDRTSRSAHEAMLTDAYFVAISSFILPPSQPPKRIVLPNGMKRGKHRNIRFSPDATKIAFLHAESGDVYANQFCQAPTNLLAASTITLNSGSSDTDAHYDPPSEFEFTDKPGVVVLKSQRHGRIVLSTVNLDDCERPAIFHQEGSVMSFFPLRDGCWDTILVSGCSLTESSTWQVVNTFSGTVISNFPPAENNGDAFGLSRDMVTEFWYEGADKTKIHCFMIRPRNFDSSKKYPWVLMPHGGPVAAWLDIWGTKWNLAAWAEQGYVVVCPNITGSTGYGLDFVRRINDDWAGRPFQDLECLISELECKPYLDQDKAAIVAASYGAYLLSWMFGSDTIKKFRCAVWHDGIFHLSSFIVQCDMMFNNVAFDCHSWPWTSDSYEKNNPARPERVRRWNNAPPTLLIHSEKDYRCPMTEGTAAFSALLSHGVPARFLTFSDECHFVTKPENSLVWHNTVLDWVQRCLNGEIKRGDTTW